MVATSAGGNAGTVCLLQYQHHPAYKTQHKKRKKKKERNPINVKKIAFLFRSIYLWLSFIYFFYLLLFAVRLAIYVFVSVHIPK